MEAAVESTDAQTSICIGEVLRREGVGLPAEAARLVAGELLAREPVGHAIAVANVFSVLLAHTMA